MRIVLAGRGKMAEALRDLCEVEDVPCLTFEEGLEVSKAHDLIAVHFGSGRQLNSLIQWCESSKVPIIQGSSGQKLPKDVRCPVIDATNLALPLIRLLGTLPALAEALKGMKAFLWESHQASKTSVPGTAIATAKIFGIPETDIVSIREPVIQMQLGVPDDFLSGHARQGIILKGGGITIRITAESNGREAYAHGALVLARALFQNRKTLEARVYQFDEMEDFLKE